MTESQLNVGIIGCGGIARFIHIPGFVRCPNVRVAVLCDVSRDAVDSAAQATGISAVTTDYGQVLANPDIAAVVIATPNDTHAKLCMDALAAGKHVLCEKPLAMDAPQAHEMLTAARAAERVHAVSFVYRYVPAVRYIKYLIDGGHLGVIRHIRGLYLQCVPDTWLGWRSCRSLAGSGTLGDIGSHLVDWGRYLLGEIGAVAAWTKTFLPQRRVGNTDCYRDCKVDDAAAFLVDFRSGATGVFEASRLVPGRGVGTDDYQYLEVNGDKGTAIYTLADPLHLQLGLREPFDDQSLITVPVPWRFLRWPGAPRDPAADPPVVGFRYDQAWAFVQAIRGNPSPHMPDFADGWRCQAVIDAILLAAETRRWVELPV